MPHKVIFYPVGNGDSSQIILENGKRILFDFHHQKQGEDPQCPAIDLDLQLRKELKEAGRDFFDVVAFTHLDDDHIRGCTDFFELLRFDKYQGPGRIKIKSLWVPAAVILEEGLEGEDRTLRQEARYRLIQGENNIRVFSNPEYLDQWLKNQGIDPKDRRHLITHAGNIAPEFSIPNDKVEFFCHSPFAEHCEGGNISRNRASLIFQVRFEVQGIRTNLLAVGDTECEALAAVVRTTLYYDNADRLEWDIFNIPHHCSYKALAADKGEKKTIPDPDVEKLLLKGQPGGYIISSSRPVDDDKAAYDQTQPPHIQAKNCYAEYLRNIGGRQFLVTMEQPNRETPEPISFLIGNDGVKWSKSVITGTATILTSVAPRAGIPGEHFING